MLFIPTKPFHKYHNTIGRLSKGGKAIENLQLDIYYSNIQDSEIKGSIVGEQELFHKLFDLKHTDGLFASFESNDKEISSNKIILGKIRTDSSIQGIAPVAEIEIWEIKILSHQWSKPPKRKVVFYLSGPSTFLQPYFFNKRWAERFPNEPSDKDPIIEIDEIFSIEAQIVQFEEESSEPDNFILRKGVLRLTVTSKNDRGQLGDEMLIERTEKSIDILLHLFSFISKFWITWFKYTFTAEDTEFSVVRQVKKCNNKEIDFRKGVITTDEVISFIPKAYAQSKKLVSDNVDLKKIILFYVAGNDDRTLEMQFVTTFMALEMLKEYYSEKNDLLTILPKGEWNSFAKKTCNFIKKELDKSKINSMFDKITELNRPSIRSVLEQMLTTYSIEWKDLYPNGVTKISFIDARNKLLHTKTHPDVNQLHKELYRLRAIVERIILRMLEWDNLENTPEYGTKDWITS